jgi:hypothetical protein
MLYNRNYYKPVSIQEASELLLKAYPVHELLHCLAEECERLSKEFQSKRNESKSANCVLDFNASYVHYSDAAAAIRQLAKELEI